MELIAQRPNGTKDVAPTEVYKWHTIERIAAEAVELLVDRMNEQQKRKPSAQKEITHKKVTPILIRRETTD